jgi:PAS domain S-box-containing protein
MMIAGSDCSGDDIARLFDHLPMVIFYIKDTDGVFIRCNRRFEEYHGLKPGAAIGLTDFNLHNQEIATRYRAEDKLIMESGIAVSNHTWMVPSAKGYLRWWLSSKTLVRKADGSLAGVAGVMHEVSGTAAIHSSFSRIEPALKLIHGEDTHSLSAEGLAATCHYSVSQFNRVFKKLMGQSPRQYIMQHRMEIAKKLLTVTNLTLTEVAIQAGFYDASELGKRFRNYEGVTPMAYRLKLQETTQSVNKID